ncbi:MAG: hypothetical protein DRR19_26450 [Candidatus Parabeggiatoa sp. nov. 1]|nr:MAG: hypothetical protein DRR19_26450 [Gammaproteobacteria bacterium]
MKQNWIIDASSLIVLGKADLLKTISPLAECWVVPESVVQEVLEKSAIEPLLSQLSENAKVERQKMRAIEPLIARWNLGEGETEVITLGLNKN